MSPQDKCDKYISYGGIQYLRSYIYKNNITCGKILDSLVEVFLELLGRGWSKSAFDLLEVLLICYTDPLINFSKRIFTAIFHMIGRSDLLSVDMGKGVLLLFCSFITKFGLDRTISLTDHYRKDELFSTLSKSVGYCRYLAEENRRAIIITGLCKVIEGMNEMDNELFKSIIQALCEFIRAGQKSNNEYNLNIGRFKKPLILNNEQMNWMQDIILDEKRYFMKSLEYYINKRKMNFGILKGLLGKDIMKLINEFSQEFNSQSFN